MVELSLSVEKLSFMNAKYAHGRYQDMGIRLLSSLLCAFLLYTIAWVACGLLTPGDYFANGSGFAEVSLMLAVVIGLIAGFRASPRWRIVIFAGSIASLCFWIFVPDGWWAHGPLRVRDALFDFTVRPATLIADSIGSYRARITITSVDFTRAAAICPFSRRISRTASAVMMAVRRWPAIESVI